MDRKAYRHFLFALVALACVTWVFPIGRDWKTYAATIDQIRAPYLIPDFTGPPYTYLVLPHALLDINIGNAINLFLNIAVIGLVAYKYGGERWHYAFALTMTSPMAINLIMSNNIDWIPLSAFLVQDWAAYPLLAMKPQALGMAALIRYKKNPRLLPLLPLVALLIVSFGVWGAWWTHLGKGLGSVPWNFAPWPYFIPIGIYLVWVGWGADDEIIAACGTPFLVPYFAPYSLAGLHVLLACRHRRAAYWLWAVGWWWVLIEGRRAGL